jgi:hypothetical protein
MKSDPANANAVSVEFKSHGSAMPSDLRWRLCPTGPRRNECEGLRPENGHSPNQLECYRKVIDLPHIRRHSRNTSLAFHLRSTRDRLGRDLAPHDFNQRRMRAFAGGQQRSTVQPIGNRFTLLTLSQIDGLQRLFPNLIERRARVT